MIEEIKNNLLLLKYQLTRKSLKSYNKMSKINNSIQEMNEYFELAFKDLAAFISHYNILETIAKKEDHEYLYMSALELIYRPFITMLGIIDHIILVKKIYNTNYFDLEENREFVLNAYQESSQMLQDSYLIDVGILQNVAVLDNIPVYIKNDYLEAFLKSYMKGYSCSADDFFWTKVWNHYLDVYHKYMAKIMENQQTCTNLKDFIKKKKLKTSN